VLEGVRTRKPDFGERLGRDLAATARDAPRGAVTFADALY